MRGAMKDSGVEWIGEIPEGWDLTKISQIYRQRNQKVSDKEYLPLSVTKNGIVPQLESAAKTEHTDDRRLVKINDFVINSRSDRRGSCGISSYDGSVSVINTVLEPFGELNGLYYNYVFKSAQFADEFYRLGHGIVDDLWSTKWSEMKRIYIPHPSVSDQHHIASFLDTKCSLIDSTIEKEREIITKLKEYRQAVITEAVTKGIHAGVPMKDSGVEWIGEIPSDWSIGKIKYTTSKIGSGKTPKGGSETYSEEGILFLRSQNIYDTGLNIEEATFISENIDEEMANTRVYSDDVLLNITGASIGRCCIYPSKMDPANVNQHVCIIRVIVNTMIPGYVHYFWVSSSGQTSIDIYQSGANREGLNFEQIGNTFMPYPSLPEQQDIVDYLDAKCSAIDATIQKRELAIEKLTAYKQSLIYECVTGKREVLG